MDECIICGEPTDWVTSRSTTQGPVCFVCNYPDEFLAADDRARAELRAAAKAAKIKRHTDLLSEKK